MQTTAVGSGGSGSSSQCYVIEAKYTAAAPSPQLNTELCKANTYSSCTNPTSNTDYTGLIHDICDVKKGGCSMKMIDITFPFGGSSYYDSMQFISYEKKSQTGSAICGIMEDALGAVENTYCEGETTGPIKVVKIGATGTTRTSCELFISGTEYSFYTKIPSRGFAKDNGCALIICNNG